MRLLLRQVLIALLLIICKENDDLTNNFMQWYISEQMEEEQLGQSIIGKLEMIGSDTLSLYLFDKEFKGLAGAEH